LLSATEPSSLVSSQDGLEDTSMELNEAFHRLKTENELAQRFMEDPEGVFDDMGVDTSNLLIQPIITTKEPFKVVSTIRGSATTIADEISICASIGILVCASVGATVTSDDLSDIVDGIIKPVGPG